MIFKSNDNFIVWVLGASGAGKATLISDLVSSDSTKWFSNLINTTNSNLFAVNESLQHVGQFPGDCIEKKRNEIIDIVIEQSKITNSVFLIKGQFFDLYNYIPSKLKLLLPDYKHIVVYLHTDSETLFERIKKKSWWTEEITINDIRISTAKMLNIVLKLKSFKKIVLDSTNKDYKQIDFPKKTEIVTLLILKKAISKILKKVN
jgi:adenylate kinase family enzyme